MNDIDATATQPRGFSGKSKNYLEFSKLFEYLTSQDRFYRPKQTYSQQIHKDRKITTTDISCDEISENSSNDNLESKILEVKQYFGGEIIKSKISPLSYVLPIAFGLIGGPLLYVGTHDIDYDNNPQIEQVSNKYNQFVDLVSKSFSENKIIPKK